MLEVEGVVRSAEPGLVRRRGRFIRCLSFSLCLCVPSTFGSLFIYLFFCRAGWRRHFEAEGEVGEGRGGGSGGSCGPPAEEPAAEKRGSGLRVVRPGVQATGSQSAEGDGDCEGEPPSPRRVGTIRGSPRNWVSRAAAPLPSLAQGTAVFCRRTTAAAGGVYVCVQLSTTIPLFFLF